MKKMIKHFKTIGPGNFVITEPELKRLSRKEIRKLDPGTRYITKGGKLGWKKNRKDAFIDGLVEVMSFVITPIYKVLKFIGKPIYVFFFPKSNFRNNGIIGPGYRSSYDRHFSWGKLSFVLVITFIIIYFIFLR